MFFFEHFFEHFFEIFLIKICYHYVDMIVK